MTPFRVLSACPQSRSILRVRNREAFCVSAIAGRSACPQSRSILRVRNRGSFCVSAIAEHSACPQSRIPPIGFSSCELASR